jgi:signal transduction histidine kinase
VIFNDYDVPKDMPSKVQLTAYRIIQEALRNIQKHSHADLVTVDLLFRNNFLNIVVEDNGIGFNKDQAFEKGRGTKNLVSRVEFLNGTYEIESSEAKGTKINIRIPINEKD